MKLSDAERAERARDLERQALDAGRRDSARIPPLTAEQRAELAALLDPSPA